MALDIKLKRSHTHSNIPTTSDLAEGEFAVNTYDRKLYMRDGSNNIVTVNNEYATDFEASTKTLYVTVASSTSAHVHHGSGSSNKYKINGVFSPYLKLIPGITYKFDQSDSSNSGHPFRFYLDENKSTAFTTGVTTSGTAGSSGAYTQIIVSHTTPAVLHYQCSAHSLMGWAGFVNTHNLTAFDTGDLTEGSNLYYTQARADARVDAGFTAKDTDNLSEGSSNLYYTDARVNARITATLIDEDNMSSNSATRLPSQQSVKSYVDATVAATNELVEDSTPQLGGNLDLNSNNITGTGNINITGTATFSSTLNGHTIPGGAGTIALTSDISSETFTSLAQDTSPQLGGNLDVVTHGIVSTSNRNITITPNGSGSVVIDGLSHPQADGNSGQVITTNGSGQLSFASVGSLAGAGISNVSDDSSPQLGGNLDVVTHSIVSTSNRDINLTPNGSGKVVVSSTGIEFSDGSVQTAAGSTQGFAIAMGIALG